MTKTKMIKNSQGDFGSPLALKSASGTYTIIGVMAFTMSSGCMNGPSGYTRVAKFVDWIDNKTCCGMLLMRMMRQIRNLFNFNVLFRLSLLFNFT